MMTCSGFSGHLLDLPEIAGERGTFAVAGWAFFLPKLLRVKKCQAASSPTPTTPVAEAGFLRYGVRYRSTLEPVSKSCFSWRSEQLQ